MLKNLKTIFFLMIFVALTLREGFCKIVQGIGFLHQLLFFNNQFSARVSVLSFMETGGFWRVAIPLLILLVIIPSFLVIRRTKMENPAEDEEEDEFFG
ncbi:MAG: hypothetical protein ACLFQV_10395 [Vulcanimicrobiota bacterium]